MTKSFSFRKSGGVEGAGARLTITYEGDDGSFTITARQLEILACKRRGLTDMQTAEDLGISRGTVKNSLETGRYANGLKNTAALVAQAERFGLLYPISRIGVEALLEEELI